MDHDSTVSDDETPKVQVINRRNEQVGQILEEKTVNLKFTLILFTLPAEGNGDAAITVTNLKNVFYISFCYYAATRE